MTDTPARARVWTLCRTALVRAALTGPLVGLLTPLAPASVARFLPSTQRRPRFWRKGPRSVAGPLTLDRLARVVADHDLPALVALLEDSPHDAVRHGAHQLRRLRAGQAHVYQRVLPGIPVALGDPFFRLDLARAAARAGLDLFPPAH